MQLPGPQNWISNETSIESIFLGHEFSEEFKFENVFLCYFMRQSKKQTIFIYDNLEYPNGIECTCTVYWIYQYFDFENILSYGDNLKYIPQCIRGLRSSQSLRKEVNQCLNGKEPLNYCRDLFFKTTVVDNTITTSTTATTYSSSSLTTSSTKTSQEITTSRALENEATIEDYLGSISTRLNVLIALVSVLIFVTMLGLCILGIRCHKKGTRLSSSIAPLTTTATTTISASLDVSDARSAAAFCLIIVLVILFVNSVILFVSCIKLKFIS